MRSLAAPSGAHVEILEPLGGSGPYPPCIKPSRVLVNGTDVGLLAKGGVVINPGDGNHEPASVTLTLLVKSVHMRAAW